MVPFDTAKKWGQHLTIVPQPSLSYHSNAIEGYQSTDTDIQRVFILGKIDWENIDQSYGAHLSAIRTIEQMGSQPVSLFHLESDEFMMTPKSDITERVKQLMGCTAVFLLDCWVQCPICIALHILGVNAGLKVYNKYQ